MPAKRQTMTEALVSIYTAGGGWSTTVTTVTTRVPEEWMEYPRGKCPALYVADADSVETPLAFAESGEENMQAEMMLFVAGVVWNETGDNITARNNLLADIKKATFAYLNGVATVTDIVSVRVSTDRGLLPKYSHFDLEITFRYLYKQSEGG